MLVPSGMSVLHNPLKEDFVFKWDGQAHLVPAGQTIVLSDYLVRHGAKHLVDFIILHKDSWGDLKLKRSSDNVQSERDEIYNIVLSDPQNVPVPERKEEKEEEKEEEKPPEPDNTDESNDESKLDELTPRRRGRPRKEEKEEEFEDIKENKE